jgi:hypothetical protein
VTERVKRVEHDALQGKPCVIVGNSPALLHTDLTMTLVLTPPKPNALLIAT